MKKSSKKIVITKAKVSDAQAIRLLEGLVWKEEVVNKYDIPMFVRFGYVFVAKQGKKLVGAIVSFRTNTDQVFVSDLVVDPKYRRMKIAEKLYRKLLHTVKGKDVVSFLDPKLSPTMDLNKKMGAKVIKKVSDAYNLNKGLETGVRLFIKVSN
jgi:ribosomal protein S18 acetylase RimI-like enzyme